MSGDRRKPGLNTGRAIADVLLSQGLITESQLRHALRVRSKLAEDRTLLNVMQELEFFTLEELNDALRSAALKVRLGDLLVELGDLSEAELDSALLMQREDESQRNKKLGEILVDQHFIREQRLIEVLANQLGHKRREPQLAKIDNHLLRQVTPQWCETFHAVPVEVDGETVLVACSDPTNSQVRESAEALLGRRVELCICTRYALNETIEKFRNRETGGRKVDKISEDTRIVRLVDEIILAALKMQSSDIHIEPTQHKLRVRFRRDGVLCPYKELSLDIAQQLIVRLKVMSKANIAEKRRHQDGKIEYEDTAHGETIDIRCSFYVSVHGETAVLRLLNRKATLVDIEEIGLAPVMLERFKIEVLDVPTGVVLVTGPTGAGKTTTMYACVDYLNDEETSIITAEEPVEYVIDGITQCSLNPKIDVTFEETLRHMVRQDPDVIVLGEIRDAQSAEAAIQAALTGHKVLTTFHTEDTIGGLLRLMNMNIETFMISSTVVSVLAQRLLRRVCPHCAKPHTPTSVEVQRLSLRPEDVRQAQYVFGHGCSRCHYTGYDGRVCIFELLVLNEKVKEAILAKRSSYEIRRISVESSGLVTLQEDGLIKAARGETSLSEVLRKLPILGQPRPLPELLRLTQGRR